MPKVGDVVLYTAFGRTLNALVLAVPNSESSHQGSAGEPALTLTFIDTERGATALPPKKTTGPLANRPWEIPTLHTEHDVVHHSHEFSADFKKAKGITTDAQIATHRGHGEWREAEVLEAIPTPNIAVEE